MAVREIADLTGKEANTLRLNKDRKISILIFHINEQIKSTYMKYDTTIKRKANSEANHLDNSSLLGKDKVIDYFVEKLQKYVETLSINY